jgi:hypothetical protein
MSSEKEPGEALLDIAIGIVIVVCTSYGLWLLFCIGLVVSGIINKQ